MSNRLRSIAKHSSIFGFAEILRKGIGFLMIPVYTHYIHPSGYGLLELFDVFMTIAGLLVGLRLGSAIIKYIHHYDNETDKEEVFTTAFVVSAILSIIILIFAWIYRFSLAQIITGDESNSKLFVLVIASFALQNIYLTGESKLLAHKKSVLYSSMSIITLAINLILNIYFIVVLDYGVYGVLIAMLSAKIINTYMVYMTTLRGVRIRFSLDKFKQMFRFSLPLIPAAIGLFVMHFSDRFFIKEFCSLDDLGIYSLAYKFGMIISVLIIAPIFSTWNTQRFEIEKTSQAKDVFSRFFTYFLALLVFAGLGVCLFIHEALQIMAPVAYHSAAKIVPLIVLSYVIYGIAGYFSLGNMLTGNTKPVGIVQTSIAAINVLLNAILIKSFGIVGAASATLLSFVALAVSSYVISQKEYRIELEWGRAGLLFATSFLLFGVSVFLPNSLSLSLLIKTMLLILFPLSLFFSHFFTSQEIDQGRALLASLFGRRLSVREGG